MRDGFGFVNDVLNVDCGVRQVGIDGAGRTIHGGVVDKERFVEYIDDVFLDTVTRGLGSDT